MEIKIELKKYIVAVSGGIDSMVLLNLLAKQAMSHAPRDRRKTQVSSLKSHEFVVAHFDHGIHEHSSEYCDFAAREANQLDLEFVSEKGHLGSDASEAAAREARYKFLRKVKKQHNADAILTAHHQDDVIETILINLTRGTGRKGLISLGSNDEIIRPLLGYSKKQIIDYAKKRDIKWREDPTNKDIKYLRNYLRIKIMPKMSLETRAKLLKIVTENEVRDREIKEIIKNITTHKTYLDKKVFNKLDHSSSREVLADFLRSNKVPFDSKLLERGVNFIKTAKVSKKFMLSDDCYFKVYKDKVELDLL